MVRGRAGLESWVERELGGDEEAKSRTKRDKTIVLRVEAVTAVELKVPSDISYRVESKVVWYLSNLFPLR
ncbi:hypothetical protein M0802_000711 [Mischocyttarus mexicanus]|nr:hypothetical protein M0802_000711 [Mischocyttarus mexicanus]